MATVPVVEGNVMVVLSVPASVSVLLTDNVLPLVIVSDPVVDVTVKPLKLVPVATPTLGVTRVGDVAKTIAPVPATAFVRVVPAYVIVVTSGAVSVLLVNVSLPARVASVPVVGRVTEVRAETVIVVPKLPLIVSVDDALLATPVPP
tara:strand:- start:126 stop:566 length:441 start_codon:yes stop_codon:yes gene_type:complete